MKTQDPALSFPNPRLLAAVYFGLLSVVGTILINALLTSIGVDEVIPVFEAVLLGMVVASITGAIFGESIVHCKRPYKMKTFWLGFSMVIASIPVFALGLLLLMEGANEQLYATVKFHNMVLFYLVLVAYSYILFGIILAIASGLAAMYLRGQLVYDILYTDKRRRPRVRKDKPALLKNKATHHRKMPTTHH